MRKLRTPPSHAGPPNPDGPTPPSNLMPHHALPYPQGQMTKANPIRGRKRQATFEPKIRTGNFLTVAGFHTTSPAGYHVRLIFSSVMTGLQFVTVYVWTVPDFGELYTWAGLVGAPDITGPMGAVGWNPSENRNSIWLRHYDAKVRHGYLGGAYASKTSGNEFVGGFGIAPLP